MEKVVYNVTGMTCSSCVAQVENSVKKLDGVKDVAVSLLTNSMIVEYDEALVNNNIEQVSINVLPGNYTVKVITDTKVFVESIIVK